MTIVSCFHGSDHDNPRPCPSRCPIQQWPYDLFNVVRGNWVLRNEHRHLVDEYQRRQRAFRVYADQFPDGRHHGPGKPRSFEAILAETS